MTIKLIVSTDNLTIGDVIAAEEGFKNNRAIVEFLARFACEEDGTPIPKDQAFSRLADIPVKQLPELMKQFQEAIGTIQDDAVPLATSAS